MGARIKGVAVHDWPKKLSWNMLEELLQALYGSQAVYAARIHKSLDCLEQKPGKTPIECTGGDEELAYFLEEECMWVRRMRKG